jgi:hypothetical protein
VTVHLSDEGEGARVFRMVAIILSFREGDACTHGAVNVSVKQKKRDSERKEKKWRTNIS